MLEFSDNVRVYTDETGKEVRSITVDGTELDGSRTYTGLTSIFTLRNLLKLSEDRIVDYVGSQKDVLLSSFSECDSITDDLLGGDRYIRE